MPSYPVEDVLILRFIWALTAMSLTHLFIHMHKFVFPDCRDYMSNIPTTTIFSQLFNIEGTPYSHPTSPTQSAVSHQFLPYLFLCVPLLSPTTPHTSQHTHIQTLKKKQAKQLNLEGFSKFNYIRFNYIFRSLVSLFWKKKIMRYRHVWQLFFS